MSYDETINTFTPERGNTMTETARRTGTGAAKVTLIETSAELTAAYNDMLSEFHKWILNSKLDASVNGLVQKDDYIYIPSSKVRDDGHGDVVASVGDYILEISGRKTIVFTPEIKEAIARGDMSWLG